MVSISMKGDFSKTEKYFEKLKKSIKQQRLDYYGKMGVDALSSATPVDSGLTASSWYYEIEELADSVILRFNNSNVKDNWCNIAVILQYGHGTGTGGWVEGRDYINPAIQPVFDDIVENLEREVTKL
jgi:hypothetical protein